MAVVLTLNKLGMADVHVPVLDPEVEILVTGPHSNVVLVTIRQLPTMGRKSGTKGEWDEGREAVVPESCSTGARRHRCFRTSYPHWQPGCRRCRRSPRTACNGHSHQGSSLGRNTCDTTHHSGGWCSPSTHTSRSPLGIWCRGPSRRASPNRWASAGTTTPPRAWS